MIVNSLRCVIWQPGFNSQGWLLPPMVDLGKTANAIAYLLICANIGSVAKLVFIMEGQPFRPFCKSINKRKIINSQTSIVSNGNTSCPCLTSCAFLTVESTVPACSPPMTEIRAFGHMNMNRGLWMKTKQQFISISKLASQYTSLWWLIS